MRYLTSVIVLNNIRLGSRLIRTTWNVLALSLFLLIASNQVWAQPQIYVAPDPEFLLQEDEGEAGDYLRRMSDLNQTRYMFENFREYYYYREQVQLDVEMLLREKYLLGLMTSINEELHERRRGNLSADLFRVGFTIDEQYLSQPQLDSTAYWSYYLYYEATSDYIRNEYHHKLIFAEAVKRRLIEDGDLESIKRMFDFDMRLAHEAYLDEDYSLAILRFNHILTTYPYSNMDDVLFFRAESEYGAGYYLTAAATYNRLINEYPETPYHVYGLSRLFYMYTQLDHFNRVYELWQANQENEFGLNVIEEFDLRWQEVSDSLDLEELADSTREYLESTLDDLEQNVPYTSEMVDQASRLYYNAGLGLYLGGYYSDAHDAFSKIPDFTPNEFRGAYLDGETLMRQSLFEESIEPLQFVAGGSFRSDEPEHVLAEVANVRLGYAFFQLSEFESSAEAFGMIDEDSPNYKFALVGLAWTNYELNHFNQVDSLSQLFVELYPEDPLVYEMTALGGFNRELVGRRSEALESYEEMLDILSGLTDVRRYVNERRVISERIRQARALEREIVTNDDPQLFLQYLDLTQSLNRLYRRIKLAELVELNSNLEEYIIERDSIRSLISEYESLRDTLARDEYKSLDGMYSRLAERLVDLASTIQMAGYQEAHTAPITQQTAEVTHHNEVTDSLIARAENEMLSLNNALASIVDTRIAVEESGNIHPWVEFEMTTSSLIDMRQSYEKTLLSLSEGRMREISEDINTWRDFAFTRYALSDMDFDFLIEQMNLLTELSTQITSIDELIEMREQEDEDGADSTPLTPPPPALEDEDEGEMEGLEGGTGIPEVAPVGEDETGSGDMIEEETGTDPDLDLPLEEPATEDQPEEGDGQD